MASSKRSVTVFFAAMFLIGGALSQSSEYIIYQAFLSTLSEWNFHIPRVFYGVVISSMVSMDRSFIIVRGYVMQGITEFM